MLAARAVEAGCPIVYVNLVGGQDELVFDGASLVVDERGAVVTRAEQFVETLFVTDLEVPERAEPAGSTTQVIDVSDASAGTAPLVVAAAAPARARSTRCTRHWCSAPVTTSPRTGSVTSSSACPAGSTRRSWRPSRWTRSAPTASTACSCRRAYSSDHSITDAERLADNLGIDRRVIAIEPAFTAFSEMLAPSFDGREPDLTEENLQSRIRGVTLMALSNKFGWLVLTTGNKSESAVGYSTLYGDTAGGFAVIKDVPKLLVYRLCRERNDRAGRELIPEAVLTKPPSAELRPDQRDDQSLPPYEELDPIIEAYVEHDRTAGELVEAGFDPALVQRIVRLIDLAEYKRRQTPPGVRITTKAFGKDRRLPITNRYRG